MMNQEAMMDEQVIDQLIREAWEALLNCGLVVRLYRKKEHAASFPFDESTQQEYLVNDHVVIWAKFIEDGEYMLARLPDCDKLQISDEFDVGGVRYAIRAITESFTIHKQKCHEVVAKRKEFVRSAG